MSDGSTIWLDEETKQDLKKLAALNDRSLVGQIRWLIRQALAKFEEQPVIEENLSTHPEI